MKRVRDIAIAAAIGSSALGLVMFAITSSEKPIFAAQTAPAAHGASSQPAQTRQAGQLGQSSPAQNSPSQNPQTPNPQAQNSPASLASTQPDPGATVYAKQCAICHGDQREGILPAFPPLLGIKRQKIDPELIAFIHQGKGRMPGFPKMPDAQMTALLTYLGTTEVSPPSMTASGGTNPNSPHPSGLAEAGGALFQQNCAFCHGRDAQGGETGPDLTRSKLVLADVNGDKISAVVREGRIEKKMPAFNFSSSELLSLVAYIHGQETLARAQKGGRRGVDVADLQTGNLQDGKAYFNGAGGCSKCHSPTGDLAGIATRFEGLQLEERMLYPRDAKSKIIVTLPGGKKIEGTLAYQDEFTVGLLDSDKVYHSWSTNRVKFSIDSPVEAHVAQFPKYTDDDVHNLMKYLQSLQ